MFRPFLILTTFYMRAALATEHVQVEQDFYHKTLNDPVAIFTGLLFIATAALVWATIRLVKGAEEASNKQLRAYVSITPDYLHSFTKRNGPVVRCTSVNHGSSPAQQVVVRGIVDILPYPLPPDFEMPEFEFHSEGATTLFPHMSQWHLIHALRDFTPDEIDKACKQEGVAFYCLGEGRYNGLGGKYRTQFCRAIAGRPDDLRAISRGSTGEFKLNYVAIAALNLSD